MVGASGSVLGVCYCTCASTRYHSSEAIYVASFGVCAQYEKVPLSSHQQNTLHPFTLLLFDSYYSRNEYKTIDELYGNSDIDEYDYDDEDDDDEYDDHAYEGLHLHQDGDDDDEQDVGDRYSARWCRELKINAIEERLIFGDLHPQ